MRRKVPSNISYRNGYVYNWFSNFEPFETPMDYDGIVSKTPEAFYQSMKTKDRYLRSVVGEMSAAKSKRAGRKLIIRDDWENIKVGVMMMALRHKFAEGTEWRKRLDETEGEIVEWNNWHDNIWGDCVCINCLLTEGKNLLGKLLMGIRDGETVIDKEFF
jgi:ribA/ribD-fused uncharacterized protein